MSASDVFVMLREIKDELIGRWILNIYQLNGTLLFKFSSDSPNKTWLVIEPGKRMHLTALTYERESKPRAFCKALRNQLRDHKVSDIEQHDFDRVVYLRAGPPEKRFTLVIELFGGGNAILLDPKDRIVSAMTFRRMKDRDIVRGAPFQFPPLRAMDPRNVSSEDLNTILDESDHELVRTLARNLNMSGTTVEEILARANLDLKLRASSLLANQREALYQGMREYFRILTEDPLNPRIIFDEEDEPTRVIVTESSLYSNTRMKKFSTFNEALDSFYSTRKEDTAVEVVEDKYQQELSKLQRLRTQQQQHLDDMQSRAASSRDAANAIYQHLNIVEELLATVRDARQQNLSWDDITKRLEDGKHKQIPAAMIFDKINKHAGRIHVNLNELALTLDIRLSATDNANQLFQRSKQLEKKVKGATIAIDDTEAKIATLREKREDELVKVESEKLVTRRRKHWYEKFRWFRTSHGMLVLGGRDAGSNQQLIRKYLEEPDLFFHADFAGAPIVIAKTQGREVTDNELLEIATFAVSYSRAWKAGWSTADTYWVKQNQVSLSAPSGEFLPKGSVMVRGDRNYIRNATVRVAVGLSVEEGLPIIIAGPEQAVQHHSEVFVVLIPGKMKASDAAKRIRKQFADQVPENLRGQIHALSIDEIIAMLPPGPVDFISE
ncbi:fibronectin-binding domain-containing protein [Candidatus Bathyarchaeota archaeon]|nr:fibronectin-binding domain-containing protein [Candidatus Bathyarchaeota archaeon]